MLPNDWHSTTQAVILAAGPGKRMQSDLPKVLHTIGNRTLVEYVVDAVEQVGLKRRPVVVVSARHNLVQETLGERVAYAIQAEQLGTGDAVRSAQTLWQDAEVVLVLYGDMPFITSDSIKRLITEHVTKEQVMTFMTTAVPNFEGPNKYFFDFGRVVRDSSGTLLKNVQKKDASPDELAITEVDTACTCFSASWLKDHLSKLTPNNNQKEYYLTDLLAVAMAEKKSVGTVPIEMKEAIGINTKEHLNFAHTIR